MVIHTKSYEPPKRTRFLCGSPAALLLLLLLLLELLELAPLPSPPPPPPPPPPPTARSSLIAFKILAFLLVLLPPDASA